MAVVKDKTLNIRVTEPEKRLVEQAASISHMGMSQFMLQADASRRGGGAGATRPGSSSPLKSGTRSWRSSIARRVSCLV